MQPPARQPDTDQQKTGQRETARRAGGAAVSVGRDFTNGIRLLLRGVGMYAKSPRLMLLGLIPALIAAVALVAALVALIYFVGDLASLVTPFADHWSPGWRTGVHVVAGIAIIGAGLLLSVLGYTALTLLIGEPFYEAIAKNVEDRLGGVPGEVDVPFWRSLPRSVLDSLRTLAITALIGVPLFLGGFIPVAGETVIPVLGAAVGGWFLTLELTGVAFERRGLRAADRRRLLRKRRPLVLGFGMATFACFLVPLGAVLLMPAAVAGGTLLAREVITSSEVHSDELPQNTN